MMGASAIVVPAACPTCNGTVALGSRHVAVTGAAVRVYCSTDCLNGVVARPAVVETEMPVPERSRARWWIAGVLALVASGGLAATYAAQRREVQGDGAVPSPDVAAVEAVGLVPAPSAPTLEAARQREQDKALVAELARDAWIHPLAGPTRRMPVNHGGAFGAERPGERPPECVSGHCGVDVGRTWGEPVYAVHDGVVDFVQRGSNDDRGGLFVRIAHRKATLFSWYFHLAAIPRAIVAGAEVRAGTIIGLLGDTGVKHSSPHLHFALSVKPTKTSRERYLDPEPLIAIWPLWIPSENGGRVSTDEPGVPMRAPAPRRPRPKPVETRSDGSQPTAIGPAPTGPAATGPAPTAPEPAP